MENNYDERVVAEAPEVLELKAKAAALTLENSALKAALVDILGAVIELSNSLGPTLDAINNHGKVIMPLVRTANPSEEAAL